MARFPPTLVDHFEHVVGVVAAEGKRGVQLGDIFARW